LYIGVGEKSEKRKKFKKGGKKIERFTKRALKNFHWKIGEKK